MMASPVDSPSTPVGLERPSSLRVWMLATRPKTLPASIAPLLVGSAVAVHEGGFHAVTAMVALLTALLLQIAANLANDALDFRRGADTATRTGPTRIVASGFVTAEEVLRATVFVLVLATISGLYLVWHGGWPFLLLGIFALVCAVAYTGGPWPLAYLGLGEVFVFIFFGPIAVTGTAYLQTLDVTTLSLAASIPTGLMAVCILIVNNVRDLEQDRLVGKRTIAVRIGDRPSRREYVLIQLGTLALPFLFWAQGWMNAWSLLTILSWPLFWQLWRQIGTLGGAQLNPTLGATGRTSLVFSVLFSVALILG
ncbi:MAG TPA: 1,4-dihydroxy-2-naphthoate polyprenyltransferase [Thermomicrobiales bacterium]|nr:1,4-dihydroxy-2-naphthoate polyprenyltransferase [Thermomicrobiales bacterium]